MTSNYYEFTEEISNFSSTFGAKDSQCFEFTNFGASPFYFYIICKQSITHLNDCVMIYLHTKYNTTVQANLLSKISILDAQERKFNIQIFKENFTTINGYSPQSGGVYFITREQILEPKNGLLVDGKLRIHFEVELLQNENSESEILSGSHQGDTQSENSKIQTESLKALENYESLLENCKHSDVVFIVGKKEFKLHKNILSARSPVFAAMFDSDLSENKQNRVDIPDVDAEVFEELVRFIYTGKLPSIDLYALELFIASDKYQFESIKEVCESSLSKNLSIVTLASVLTLADMHSAKQLKSKCMTFFIKNAAKIMKTEDWKKLAKTKHHLVLEVLEELATKAEPYLK